jgi:hypothetical protein
MEQLSFSHKPNEKIFFLGELAGFAKIGAARADVRAAVSGAKKNGSSYFIKTKYSS